MSSVYAIRKQGTIEARYVGHTAGEVSQRAIAHVDAARAGKCPRAWGEWLIGHSTEIEVVELSQHDTVEDGLAAERRTILALHNLGHRLFNQHGLPVPSIKKIRRPLGLKTQAHMRLLDDVIEFCAVHAIPMTLFGRGALGDPRFVVDLQSANRVPNKTVKRVRNFMATYRSAAPASAPVSA